jgi:hypothetical protein
MTVPDASAISTSEPRSWDVAELATLDDHIVAMLNASSNLRRVAVLGSAESHFLGGIRMVCQRHPGSGEMTFRELRRHARLPHEPGDVVPAPDDPRELGRSSDRCEP